jgi:hypothetical protein
MKIKKGPAMRSDLGRRSAIALTVAGGIGLVATQTAAQQAAPNGVPTPAATAVFANGALNVPGSPIDVDTVPSKFSARTEADDKLPIAAYTFKHLNGERRAIYQSLHDKQAPGSNVASIESYSVVGAQIPTAIALNGLLPLPDAIVSRLPELRGFMFTTAGDKFLLVDPNLRMVIAVLDP